VGIEPTQRASRIAARGFEVRGAHQHPFASTGAVILRRACIVLQERGLAGPPGAPEPSIKSRFLTMFLTVLPI